jgi:hypothetical protein
MAENYTVTVHLFGGSSFEFETEIDYFRNTTDAFVRHPKTRVWVPYTKVSRVVLPTESWPFQKFRSCRVILTDSTEISVTDHAATWKFSEMFVFLMDSTTRYKIPNSSIFHIEEL